MQAARVDEREPAEIDDQSFPWLTQRTREGFSYQWRDGEVELAGKRDDRSLGLAPGSDGEPAGRENDSRSRGFSGAPERDKPSGIAADNSSHPALTGFTAHDDHRP